MDESLAKKHLLDSLQSVREAVVWKLEGLGEYDVRRPLTPTGTNLLGLVKHLSMDEAWYLGEAFGRPFEEKLTWWDDDAEPDVDMWATPQETREEIVGRYRRAWAHSDATIAETGLDAVGHVPWWSKPEISLHRMLVRVIAETNRHAGQIDILREQLDGVAGLRRASSNLPGRDADAWAAHRERVEQAARKGASSAGEKYPGE